MTLLCVLAACLALSAAIFVMAPPPAPVLPGVDRVEDDAPEVAHVAPDTVAPAAFALVADQDRRAEPAGEDAASNDDELAPEHAIALGLEGLRHLHPASNAEQEELLDLACAGAWAKAVVAYRAYAADEVDRVDAALCSYLLQLRTTGLYIEAAEDASARRLAFRLIDATDGTSMSGLVRAALFDVDAAIVHSALWALVANPQHADAIYARLEALAAGDEHNAQLAADALSFLRDGAEPPLVPDPTIVDHANDDTSWIPGAHAPQMPRLGDLFEVDSTGYSVAELPALRELYASADERDRFRAARIVADHHWPAAYAFAVTMLGDSSPNVRWAVLDALIAYGSERAATAMASYVAGEDWPELRAKVAVFVLDANSPATAPAREQVFAVALGTEREGTMHISDHVDAREAAIRALENGRIVMSAAVVDAIIDKLFRGEAWPRDRARVLKTVAEADGSDRTVARALSAGFASHSGETAEALVHAIAYAFEDRRDDSVVDLYALALRHADESVRLAAIHQLGRQFRLPALALFREVCLGDTDAVAVCAIEALEAVVDHPDIIAFVYEQALAHRPAVEDALAKLIHRHGSVAMMPALLELCASTQPQVRCDAVAAADAIGDRRQVDVLSPMLADTAVVVVASAVRTISRLLAIAPVDPAIIDHVNPVSPGGDVRRIDDRDRLHAAMLARLASGELNAAVWFVVRFPDVRLPADPEAYTGENLARLYSNALGIAIGPPSRALRAESGPTTASVTIRYTDRNGKLQSATVPREYYRRVLRPNTNVGLGGC